MSVAVLRGIAKAAIDLIALPALPKGPTSRVHAQRYYSYHEASPELEHVDILDELGTLYDALLDSDLEHEWLLLLEKEEDQCRSSMHIDHYELLVFPFMTQVIRLSEEKNVHLLGSAYEARIKGILQQYRSRSAAAQPLQPMNWVRPLPNSLCGCSTCKRLREFLEDPDRLRMEIPVIFKVRQHAERVLGADFDT